MLTSIIIQQMSQELNQEYFQGFSEEQQFSQNQVRLRLVNPKIFQKKLSLDDLYDLRQKCPLIRRYSLCSNPHSQQFFAVISFDSAEDVLDFQQESMQNITYSIALIENRQFQSQKKLAISYQPNKLNEQINQQGFCIENGSIRLKKQTSLQVIVIQFNADQKQQQLSTLINSQKNFDIDEYSDQQGVDQQIQKNRKSSKLKLNFMKSIFEGVALAGMIYGGVKLFKYFVKL